MKLDLTVAILVVMGCLTAVAVSEIPNLRPEELQESATHIVVGKVNHVYTSESESEDTGTFAGVIEITVSRIEKGDGLQAGHVVYGRFWRKRSRPGAEPDPGSSGHRGLPEQGESIRMYLKRADDGGYDVLLPNGVSPATR